MSLSGSVLDFIACTDATCLDGFAFDTTGFNAGFQVFTSGLEFGDAFEEYDIVNFSLTPRDAAVIPLPASALLLLGSIAGLAALKRRGA